MNVQSDTGADVAFWVVDPLAGHPILASLPGEVITRGPASVPVPTVYIERAWINPAGNDAGQEIVVIASLSTAAQNLTGWRLRDKNARVTPIDVSLGAGASVAIALDGAGVQLGNQGGNLILEDDTSAQVDVVTYTAGDAAVENRYVRFRR